MEEGAIDGHDCFEVQQMVDIEMKISQAVSEGNIHSKHVRNHVELVELCRSIGRASPAEKPLKSKQIYVINC